MRNGGDHRIGLVGNAAHRQGRQAGGETLPVVQLAKERYRLLVILRATHQVATEVARHPKQIERFRDARLVFQVLKAALVELALRMAVARRNPEAGLLHHSDRGSEFTSDSYQAALQELGIEVSMSRTANCWDNAAMESFFATLTKECTDRVRFQTRQEARSAIFEFLEYFYNPVQLHSTLQYVSPLTFEQATQSKMS